MYGLVNKAVRDLVCTNFGDDAWRDIVALAEIEDDEFVSMEAYDDALTYRLVAAASERLGLSPAEVLRAFGEYWTKFTVREGYGNLIGVSGRNVEEFLEGLDDLHARVQLSFPKLRPPSFRVERVDGELYLHYISEREGLAPMVVGLLEGLGVHFDQDVEVLQIEQREAHGHDVFRLRIKDRSPG